MLPLVYVLSPFFALGIQKWVELLGNLLRINLSGVTLLVVSYIFLASLPVNFKPIRQDVRNVKATSLEISQRLPIEEIRRCSENACSNLIFSGEARIFFYLSQLTKHPLCPAGSKYEYIKILKKSDSEVLTYLKEKNYRVVVLDKSVLKERLSYLSEKLKKEGFLVIISD